MLLQGPWMSSEKLFFSNYPPLCREKGRKVPKFEQIELYCYNSNPYENCTSKDQFYLKNSKKLSNPATRPSFLSYFGFVYHFLAVFDHFWQFLIIFGYQGPRSMVLH